MFILFLIVYIPSIYCNKKRESFISFAFICLSSFNSSQGKTHTPVGPTCGRIWHLVMTCCLCKIEMSETQATSFMNEYSMHNAMQNSRTGIEKSTDSKSSIDEIAFSM